MTEEHDSLILFILSLHRVHRNGKDAEHHKIKAEKLGSVRLQKKEARFADCTCLGLLMRLERLFVALHIDGYCTGVYNKLIWISSENLERPAAPKGFLRYG